MRPEEICCSKANCGIVRYSLTKTQAFSYLKANRGADPFGSKVAANGHLCLGACGSMQTVLCLYTANLRILCAGMFSIILSNTAECQDPAVIQHTYGIWLLITSLRMV